MKAIPTLYDGTKFRSKLEAQWAKLLDHYGIPWTYESEGYEFEDGTKYLPDFWLPDSKQWLEVKGIMNDKDMHKCEMLAKESGHEVAIGYADGEMQIITGNRDEDGELEVYEGRIGLCSRCGKYFVYQEEADWRCRCCDAYDGDGHFAGVFEPREAWNEFATIDVMVKTLQDTVELKPCPFCGNDVEMTLESLKDDKLCWSIPQHATNANGNFVCMATMRSRPFPTYAHERLVLESRSKLADAWNSREAVR